MEKHPSKLLAGECQRQTYMKETYQSYAETLEQFLLHRLPACENDDPRFFRFQIKLISPNSNQKALLRKFLQLENAGCPVPIFSYFCSLFPFPPIFKLKPPSFPIFQLVKSRFVAKLKMEYKLLLQLYVFQSEVYHKESSIC